KKPTRTEYPCKVPENVLPSKFGSITTLNIRCGMPEGGSIFSLDSLDEPYPVIFHGLSLFASQQLFI
ncbi:hypothetical protein, partial [Pseudomonas syringae]|uniref:hypothetical protein n=1 Tax=Pseudomonas syringae TaxID=317 RepID=UPI0034D5F6B7